MKRFLAPALIGVIGTAILVALGVWQLQRLTWKEAVLFEIETRMASPEAELPVVVDPAAHRFLPVRVSGELDPEPLFVFTTVKGLGARLRVIQALRTTDGRRILVELGTVDPQAAYQVGKAGTVALQGMLHWPDEVDVFTPKPDLENSIWYARDIDVLAQELGSEPVLVVASDVVPRNPLVQPLPLDPGAIPNDHLQYAVTWFGLAVVWVGMTALWLRRIARARHLER